MSTVILSERPGDELPYVVRLCVLLLTTRNLGLPEKVPLAVAFESGGAKITRFGSI